MSHISLLELSKRIRTTLEDYLEETYWVVAEIGEMRQHQRGHCYLELVEKLNDALVTKQRATIWSTQFRTISHTFEQITGQFLAPGLNILCQVQVQYHELYGLSLNIRDIDPNYTLGERARKRAEIVQRLIADGVFALNRVHELAIAPQRIAVISSKTAAGWGDFLHQLLMNPYHYRFEVALFNASMQGDSAQESICQALNTIAESKDTFDAIVIIRGGGARVDLDCFDQYDLAAAIARAPLPVLTGIGHDRDETIADLVAHTRLKTPTAVAEFLIARLRGVEEQLHGYANAVFAYAQEYQNRQAHLLGQLGQQLLTSSKNMLAAQHKQIKHLSGSLGSSGRYKLKFETERLRNLQRMVYTVADKALCQETSKLDQLALTLHLQDPERLLRKGYTLSYLDGKPLRLAGKPKAGQLLITHAHNQIITSKIEDSTPNTPLS